MSEGLLDSPLVSIIISNYNYGHFLREAIDSALDQTYSCIEVIVVDDGSTDDSREVIEGYKDRITPVLKENGGHASGCNAGFAASKGEIIIFLDADDTLLPSTTHQVVRAFQSRPDIVKVQYRLRFVDVRGKPTGELEPPGQVHMPNGDLRQHILRFHSYNWPSTSGNAFRSALLRQILPIPEVLYRGMPDLYLCALSPVFGPIASLDEVGALYRVHGTNSYHSTMLDIAQIRRLLVALADTHVRQRHLFAVLYSANVQEIGSRDQGFLSMRVISLKLDPQNHPFEDGLLPLCVRGCKVSMTTPDPTMRKSTKLLWCLWFMVMYCAPKPLARSLAEKLLFPEKKGWLYHKMLALLRQIL